MLSPVKALTAGAVVFALGGLFLVVQPFGQQEAGVPGAQSPESTAVQVTVTQECAGRNLCPWTASDPRLTGTVSTVWGDVVGLEGKAATEAGWQYISQAFEGPDDVWIGHVYVLWGRPTQNFLVLSGTGTNEGWHYIASGTDPMPDGDFEWIGTLFEGELPPFPGAPAE